MTITEALAEIKTIKVRVDKKWTTIGEYLARDNVLRDPFESEGGSAKWIERELQSIFDLQKRVVELRLAIQKKNIASVLAGTDKTVAEWLVWRRDVAPVRTMWLDRISQALGKVKDEVRKHGKLAVSDPTQQNGVTINIDEAKLASEIDQLDEACGSLDGKLSLFNATTHID